MIIARVIVKIVCGGFFCHRTLSTAYIFTASSDQEPGNCFFFVFVVRDLRARDQHKNAE